MHDNALFFSDKIKNYQKMYIYVVKPVHTLNFEIIALFLLMQIMRLGEK